MSPAVPSAFLAVHLDHGEALLDQPRAAHAVGEILVRPCFGKLRRLSARRRDRWSKYTKPSAEQIAAYLGDVSNDAISLDSGRSGELVAGAEIENGVGREAARVFATRLQGYIVVPHTPGDIEAVVTGVCDLASVLGVSAGFIALETSYGLAHRAVVMGSRPKERVGLSQQRLRERRGRHHYDDRLVAELAGVEWGTFLGPGHLAKVDLAELRRSGAFARVVEVTPTLAYLQVTEDPLDDLTEGFEQKLIAARRALAPLLMDVSAISLK
jgi:hypothetical protein